VVQIDGVTLRRGRGASAVTVLRDANLTVRAGEIVGISGPSGAGKSSLIKVLCGELNAEAGIVELRAATCVGPPIRVRRAVPGSIALIDQDPMATLDALWTVGQSVAEPLRAAGIARKEARRRALVALDMVGLGHLGPDRQPHELSLGQAQRVCVARALAAQPALLLADEATSALDVTNAAGVVGLIRQAADGGTAVIMVSHDHRLLDAVSDRRLCLTNGRLETADQRDLDKAKLPSDHLRL
jgi:ABC-type glutathione transport system ATPase component